MSTYREIVGKKVKSTSSDFSTGIDGEIWYNSATGNFRGQALVEAISSSSPLIYTNFSGGTFGTQTAAVIGGGYSPPTNPPGFGPPSAQTQEYNGSGWSAGGDLGTGRGALAGFGISTAGVIAGGPGSPTPWVKTEEYNGTAWTAGGDLSTGRRGTGNSAGIETAGLVFGGYVGPAGTTATEEYGGTSWTAGGVLNTPVYYNTGTGIQTAAVSFGGNGTNISEEYNGSSWASGNNMNSPRQYAGAFGAQTAAIVAGGSNPPTTYLTAVEKYDGTTFTVSPATLSSPRALTGQAAGGTSGNTAGVFAGGYAPGDSPSGDYGNRIVEEYNQSVNTITAAAWASGGALNTGRINVSMGGTQTAGIVLGGHTSPGAEPKGVETYNGSAFTAGTAIGPYSGDYAAYAGSSTAGIIFGGAPYSTTTAEFDGEWSAGGALSTGRSQLMGAGTGETSAVAIGGFTDSTTSTTATEEYGGTSWTSGGALPTQRGRGAGFGIETAALVVGGNTSPDTAVTANSEEYGGTSWTAGGSIFIATGTYIGGWGTQADGAIVGGANPSYVATTLGYDGTAWATLPSAAYAAGRTQTAGANGSAGLRAGGGPNTSQRDGSEEFTGETTAANIKNFSYS